VLALPLSWFASVGVSAFASFVLQLICASNLQVSKKQKRPSADMKVWLAHVSCVEHAQLLSALD